MLRESVVAGRFYPEDKEELNKVIDAMLSEAKSFEQKNIRAIIVPHAGYVFSAPIASIAYKTLHKEYKNVFLLGSSHHVNFNGVSIYDQGDYKTPLGVVQTNKVIIKDLIEKNSFITYEPKAHTKEHTLEVQLPFLQHIYGNKLKIVPIIMATSDLQTITTTAKALQDYFKDEENLFVISTDLSHYPSYDDANIIDLKTIDGILSNSVEKFIDTIVKNEDAQIANLSTSACGWSSILTLLYLTQNKQYKYELLEYKNSGDTPKYGSKDRVVGYGAIRIYNG